MEFGDAVYCDVVLRQLAADIGARRLLAIVLYHHPSALDAWGVFIDVINIAVSLFVPKYNAASPSATRRLRHYPHTLHKLTRKKRSLWKKCKNSRQNPIVRGLYRDCANQWRQEILNIEMAKENDIIESNARSLSLLING